MFHRSHCLALVDVYLSCAIFPAFSQTTIDPAEFDTLAQASADLFRVINRFHDTIRTYDPFFLIDGEVVFATSPFTIPTSGGDIQGYPTQFDAIMFIRCLKWEDISLRLFFIPVNFSFTLDQATVEAHPTFDPEGGADSGLFGLHSAWTDGYVIFGLQGMWGRNRLSIGAFGKTRPVITGSAGSEVFDSQINPETGDWVTATTGYDNIYFDGDVEGYVFNSLISFSGYHQIGAEKLFEIPDTGLSAGPGLYWSAPLSLIEVGGMAKYEPAEWLSLEAEAFAGYAYDDGIFGFTRSNLGVNIPLVIGPNENNPERSCTLVFRIAGSVHATLRNEIETGGVAEIQLSHIPWWTVFNLLSFESYVSISAGISFNDEEMLRRMPIHNQLLFYVKFRGNFYRKCHLHESSHMSGQHGLTNA